MNRRPPIGSTVVLTVTRPEFQLPVSEGASGEVTLYDETNSNLVAVHFRHSGEMWVDWADLNLQMMVCTCGRCVDINDICTGAVRQMVLADICPPFIVTGPFAQGYTRRDYDRAFK